MKAYLLTSLCLVTSICFATENIQKMSTTEVKALCTQQAASLQKNAATAPFSKKAYASCLSEYVKLGAVDGSILASSSPTKTPEVTPTRNESSNDDLRTEINEVTSQFVGKKITYDGMNQPNPAQLQALFSKHGFAAVDYFDFDFSLPASSKPKKTKYTGYPSRVMHMDKPVGGKDSVITVYLARKPANDWLFVLSDNGLKSASWSIIDAVPINSQKLSDLQLTSTPDCKFGGKKIANWVALLPPPKMQGDFCKTGKTLEWGRTAIAGNVWSINAAGKIIREDVGADVVCFSKSKDHCKNEYDDGDL
jgi:hypothetical protein